MIGPLYLAFTFNCVCTHSALFSSSEDKNNMINDAICSLHFSSFAWGGVSSLRTLSQKNCHPSLPMWANIAFRRAILSCSERVHLTFVAFFLILTFPRLREGLDARWFPFHFAQPGKIRERYPSSFHKDLDVHFSSEMEKRWGALKLILFQSSVFGVAVAFGKTREAR